MVRYLTLNFGLFFQPPLVHCETILWHPNISENGAVCLSLLRQSSLDGLGWAPTRRLKDIVWGLNSLFTVSRIYNLSPNNTISINNLVIVKVY